MSETPEEYIQRMMAQLGGEKPLKIQAGTAAKLGRLVGARPPGSCGSGPLRGNGPPRKSLRIWRTAKLLRAGGCGKFSVRPERRFRRLTRTPGPQPATMRNATRANRSSSFARRGKATSLS